MGLFDSIPVRSNGDDILAAWFNTIRTTLNNVFDAFALNDLTDVTISAPTNGQTLVFNSINSKWENGAAAGGGGLGQLENIALIGKGTANWKFEAPVGNAVVAEYDVDFADIPLNTNIENGFTFIPSKTGDIQVVVVGLVNRGLANGDGNWKGIIYATDGAGLPTGAPLDTSSTSNTSGIAPVNTVLYINAVFNANVQLQAGVRYACMIESTDTGTLNLRRGNADQSDSENILETGAGTGNFAQNAEQNTMRHTVRFTNLDSGGTLILDSTSFISVPDLLTNRHKIAAQTIEMEDDQVAWVTIDRNAPAEAFVPVTVSNIVNFVSDGNRLIIAQSVGGECHLGIVDPQRIGDGETIDLQQGKGLLRPVGTLASPITVDETVGIIPTKELRQIIFVESDGGTQTVTANPQIAAGTRIGQELTLVGTSDTDELILNDGTGLKLNGALKLNNNQSAALFWNSTDWQEISRR